MLTSARPAEIWSETAPRRSHSSPLPAFRRPCPADTIRTDRLCRNYDGPIWAVSAHAGMQPRSLAGPGAVRCVNNAMTVLVGLGTCGTPCTRHRRGRFRAFSARVQGRARRWGTQRMRIAMIGQKGVPATVGGIERHVEELGARLVDRGHEVTVFCRRSYSDDRRAEYRGMRLRHLPTVAPSTSTPSPARSSPASSRPAASTSCTTTRSVRASPSPIPRYGSRAAVVQTMHGLDDEQGQVGRGRRRAGLRLAQSMSARLPDETIVVSQALQEHYRAEHGRETVLRPQRRGRCPTARATHAVLDPPRPRDRGYVLFVGRLVPEKAVDVLIRAFRERARTTSASWSPGRRASRTATSTSSRALAADDPRVLSRARSSGRSSRRCTSTPPPSRCPRGSRACR